MSVDSEPVSDVQKAADEGDAQAQFETGMRYAAEGAERNADKARKYLSMAAKQDLREAFEPLADLYGKEKPENWAVFADFYYRRAISAGSATAPEKLADYYYLGDGNSNKVGALLYLESARRNPESCERPVSILTRMYESNWIDPEWKFFAGVLEVLADNGNREAKHMIRREEVPEPTDQFDLDTFLGEAIELPEEEKPPEEKPVRRWGRTSSKRSLTSLLYDMGIEFTRSSNGLIKTKQGREIEDQIQKLIARGYKFKYSDRTDKWTVMDKKQ